MAKHEVGDYVYVYDDKERLGRGSFGEVLRGHRKHDESEKVAVKVINLRDSTVKRAGSSIKKEIEISKTLQETVHTNLVAFKFCTQIEFTIYLVMEFCNGGNLFEYLDELKTLTEPTIRCFFRQIGAGVKFLHGKGIIHRDLKPENILLNFDAKKYPAPENIQLKIADFGLGRFLTLDEKATTNCGTFYYKAPEVASKNYDKKVDLWSIGVMIYECVGGTKKALGSDNVVLPQDITEDLKDVSQDLSELLKNGLLVKEPQKRFDCDRLMGHRFMLENVLISILGDRFRTREMTISKTSSTDELYKKVTKSLDAREQEGDIHLYLEGRELARGSTVEDAGIRNGSNVALVYRQSGGICKRNQTRTSTLPLTLNLL